MRILVTGASGYLGRCLSERWVHRGHEVFALTRNFKSLPPGVQRVSLADGLTEWTSSVDLAVHTACLYGRGTESWSDILESNVLSPLRLLRAIPPHAVFLNADTVLPPDLNSY